MKCHKIRRRAARKFQARIQLSSNQPEYRTLINHLGLGWSWVWWYTPAIPALQRWKLKDIEFMATLGYLEFEANL
jgi:hypothetical protein